MYKQRCREIKRNKESKGIQRGHKMKFLNQNESLYTN